MIHTFAVFFLTSLLAFAYSPELSRIEPRGGQIGTEVEVRLLGDRLFEPQEILLYHEGITVKSLTKVRTKKV